MKSQILEAIAKALVADGKGILAADETVGTLTKRFERLKIQSTPGRGMYSILYSMHCTNTRCCSKACCSSPI